MQRYSYLLTFPNFLGKLFYKGVKINIGDTLATYILVFYSIVLSLTVSDTLFTSLGFGPHLFSPG